MAELGPLTATTVLDLQCAACESSEALLRITFPLATRAERPNGAEVVNITLGSTFMVGVECANPRCQRTVSFGESPVAVTHPAAERAEVTEALRKAVSEFIAKRDGQEHEGG